MKYQWADIFPFMQARKTADPRIFHTLWEKDKVTQTKKRAYFCCIVKDEGNNCYGVDVLKPKAIHSEKECEEAYFKVKLAADYYENNGEWPKE